MSKLIFLTLCLFALSFLQGADAQCRVEFYQVEPGTNTDDPLWFLQEVTLTKDAPSVTSPYVIDEMLKVYGECLLCDIYLNNEKGCISTVVTIPGPPGEYPILLWPGWLWRSEKTRPSLITVSCLFE